MSSSGGLAVTDVRELLASLDALEGCGVTIEQRPSRGRPTSFDVGSVAGEAAAKIRDLEDEIADQIARFETLEGEHASAAKELEELRARVAEAERKAEELDERLDYLEMGDDQ